MAEKQNAIEPVQGEIEPATTTGGDPTTQSTDLFSQMNDVLQGAVQAFLLQDVPTVRACANMARGILENARATYGKDDLDVLDFLCRLTCFYEPLVSALAMQVEGRYTDAISLSDDAIQRGDELQQLCGELSKLPDWKDVLVTSVEPSLRPYPAFLRGMRTCAEAELFGYQGNIEKYVQLLKNAASEYRSVNKLRPSTNPVFLQLVKTCTQSAERLESRIRNFEPMLHNVRYMSASGDKILIIHGHNEKWRELKDLLKQAGREVVVIEEMPDQGEVLIDKCIKYASDCCFAIALFTPDDMVKVGKRNVFQARPNVLFELGWFYGRFGPQSVLILKQGDMEMPSDLAGVLTKNFQANVTEVMSGIEKELPPLRSKVPVAA